MIPDANINSPRRSSTSFANPNSRLKSKSDRRRCLKTLFHIPLGARSKSCGYDDMDGTLKKASNSTTLAGCVLPQDIIRDIVDLLSPSDILSFSLTVSVFFGGLLSSFFSLSLWLLTFRASPRSHPTSVPSSFQPYTTQLSSNQVNTAALPSQCFLPIPIYARTSKS